MVIPVSAPLTAPVSGPQTLRPQTPVVPASEPQAPASAQAEQPAVIQPAAEVGSYTEAGFDASQVQFGSPAGAVQATEGAVPAQVVDATQDQATLNQARTAVQQQLQQLASQNPETLRQLIGQIYGAKATPEKTDELVRLASEGQFPMPANLQFLDNDTIQGNNGAYSPDNGGTVYLNRNLAEAPGVLAHVLLQESGHHIDQWLGGEDSSGDEGLMFATGVQQGQPLSPEDLEAGQQANDRAVLRIGDRDVEVETAIPLIVGGAIWAGKVAASTTVDIALDVAIAALTGLPPPGPLDNMLTTILNAIPVLGELDTGKKIAKLTDAIRSISTSLHAMSRFPSGQQMMARIQRLGDEAVSALRGGRVEEAGTKLGRLIQELGDAQNLNRGVRGSVVRVVSDRNIAFNVRQLEQKFRTHATDFGFPNNNFNRAAGQRFQEVLENHVRNPDTLPLEGLYRGQPATVYYNPQTQLAVIKEPNGQFLSGWRLTEDQRRNFLSRGRLN